MTSLRTMLYVSCGETQDIVRFELDCATGDLRRMGGTPLPGAPDPMAEGAAKSAPQLRSNGAPLTINAEGTMLYVATRTEPCRALSYRIAPLDGDLALIGEAPIPEGTPYIAMDQSGRYLLGAAYHANSVWVSRIDTDGAVTTSPVQIVEQLGTTHCVLVHGCGEIAYVASTGMSSIQIFRLEGGNAPLIEQMDAVASTSDATPRHLAMRPDQRFLYCMNETTSIVDVFAVSDGGRALTPVQSIDLRPSAACDTYGLGADIMVSGDGRFLYCTERMRGTLSVFAIKPDSGFLSPVQTASVGSIPRSLAIDPSGQFLATAMQGDGVVHIHAVSPHDGKLTHCATYETGGTPIWVEFVALNPPA